MQNWRRIVPKDSPANTGRIRIGGQELVVPDSSHNSTNRDPYYREVVPVDPRKGTDRRVIEFLPIDKYQDSPPRNILRQETPSPLKRVQMEPITPLPDFFECLQKEIDEQMTNTPVPQCSGVISQPACTSVHHTDAIQPGGTSVPLSTTPVAPPLSDIQRRLLMTSRKFIPRDQCVKRRRSSSPPRRSQPKKKSRPTRSESPRVRSVVNVPTEEEKKEDNKRREKEITSEEERDLLKTPERDESLDEYLSSDNLNLDFNF